MSYDLSSTFLRRALLLDAAASGATGLLLIAGANLVDRLLGLPAALLRGAGLVLVPYVAFVIWAGTRETVSRPAVGTIIAANALLLVSGWVVPPRSATPSSSARPWWWRCWASCSMSACAGRWRQRIREVAKS